MKTINKNVFQWFDHFESMGYDRIAERIYVGKCVGSRLVSRPGNNWIESVNDCSKKKRF